jgi:XTP/dITP diphosphohydrolase
MQGLKNRQATFETVIAYYNPQANIEKVFSGSIEGTITLAPRGEKVFGYDQIFQPIHSQKTFSELESAKNEFSHRQMAIQKFINYEQGSENNDSEN